MLLKKRAELDARLSGCSRDLIPSPSLLHAFPVGLTSISNIRSITSLRKNRVLRDFGEHSLWIAIQEYIAHYHAERNHQGLNNQLIIPSKNKAAGPVQRKQRLGGTLSYYHRNAA